MKNPAFLLVLVFLVPGPLRAAPEILGYLPSQGVTATGEAEHFAGKKLFDYMNGGAELYLAYGFVDIGVRDYQSGDAKATVAVYQMGGPADAFGIFATAAKGERLDVGVPAALAPGMLSFFKGRFYVRVVAKSSPAQARALLVELGKQVASKLPGESKPPAEVNLLPQGWVDGTLRYLPNPQTARTVWFDGEGDVLLTKGSRSFAAFYPGDEGDVQLTRATYPSPDAAVQACRALAKKLGVQADDTGGSCKASGRTQEETFTNLAAREGVLRWASGASSAQAAQAWMQKIR